MAIKRRKRKNTPLGGPRWAMSNNLHVRFSAAFCPGEQLLWLVATARLARSWGCVFFRFPLAVYTKSLYEVAEMSPY